MGFNSGFKGLNSMGEIEWAIEEMYAERKC